MVSLLLAKLQLLILVALTGAALAAEVYALADAVRARADAFPAAGKLTKNIWMGILVVAVMLGFLGFASALAALGVVGLGVTNPLGFLVLVAAVAAGIYLADVRPAVRQISGGGRYEPW